MPGVSVSAVIPAWNAAATIAEAIESIAQQTRRADEVILVDDGSSDGTAEVARRAHSPLRVLTQPRSGPAAALNRGVAAGRSSLVAFLDADDRWPPSKLALQLGCLERSPGTDAVLGRVTSFLCPRTDAEAARRFRVPEGSEVAWLTGALLVRREALLRVGPFAEDLRAGYAIDWFDRARAAGLRLELLECTVLERRIQAQGLSHRSPQRDAGYLEVARRALARRRPPPCAGTS